jgi:hypothetical protein
MVSILAPDIPVDKCHVRAYAHLNKKIIILNIPFRGSPMLLTPIIISVYLHDFSCKHYILIYQSNSLFSSCHQFCKASKTANVCAKE